MVGPVDARGYDFDEHLARPGLRSRPFRDLEDFGCSEFRDLDNAHESLLQT